MSTDRENFVEVPNTSCPLDDHNLTLLQQSVNVTIDDRNFGINLYNDTLAEVAQLLEAQST